MTAIYLFIYLCIMPEAAQVVTCK